MAIKTEAQYETQKLLQNSLLKEFEEYKAVHKYAILKAKAVKYFQDLEANSATIPDFMRQGQTPESLADGEIRNLMCIPDNLATFNKLYEQAYQELAEVLP